MAKTTTNPRHRKKTKLLSLEFMENRLSKWVKAYAPIEGNVISYLSFSFNLRFLFVTL